MYQSSVAVGNHKNKKKGEGRGRGGINLTKNQVVQEYSLIPKTPTCLWFKYRLQCLGQKPKMLPGD